MKILVRVKPNSREETLTALADGSWLAKVKAPAQEGKANAALVALLAKHFAVSKSQVSLVVGQRGRQKIFEIN
jgi:hypothetical protein